MVEVQIIWDEDDDPDGNVAHILDGHDMTLDEVEEILRSPFATTAASRSSGRPITYGTTSAGKSIAVVWEELCDDPRLIRPITAYRV